MWNGMDPAQVQWLFVAGIGVAIGALALVVGQRAWHKPALKEKEAGAEANPSGDPYPQVSKREKRRVFRRKGRCVEVDLTDQEVRETPWRGWVVDRSLGGLRLTIDRDLPIGTTLNVRVGNLAMPMPWLEIKVQNCKPNGQSFEIGCEFVTPPTWNLMLMFG